MLFKQVHLQGIKDGKISLAIRKWKSPRVKAGSKIKTAVGLVEILSIKPTTFKELSSSQAIQAGYVSLESLSEVLVKFKAGILFIIELRYAGEDPRIQMRENTRISQKDMDTIIKKLRNMDKRSTRGHWTKQVLHSIKNNPELKAADLATMLDCEKDWLKINVRKLKNLGLTISHGVGYSISPLGKVIIENLLINNH